MMRFVVIQKVGQGHHRMQGITSFRQGFFRTRLAVDQHYYVPDNQANVDQFVDPLEFTSTSGSQVVDDDRMLTWLKNTPSTSAFVPYVLASFRG